VAISFHVVPAVGLPFLVEPTSDSVVVGRSSDAEIAVPDRAMSRRHARLFRSGDRWYVEDLGSRNGTVLDGRRIESPTVLAAGSILRVGATTINVDGSEVGAVMVGDAAGFDSRTVFRPVAELLREPEGLAEAGEGAADGLRRYAARLKVLTEVHQALDRSMSLDELLELILDRAFETLQPEEGAIVLRGEDGEYVRAASRTLRDAKSRTLYSRNLVRQVVEEGQAALVFDAATDERFNQAVSLLGAGVRSLIAAPLLDPHGPLGMIVLSSSLGVRRFTEDDMELLSSLASIAAMRICNTRLAEQALERERLERDVALARQIQVGLLPAELPTIEGWQLFARNKPSRGVSGDFYKVEQVDDGSCAVLIADVSGKGIAASLLTASLEALSAGLIHDGVAPDEVFGRVSHLLFERTPPEKFATAFLATFRPGEGLFRFCNAGHNPGILLRTGGDVDWLHSTGVPLGILAEAGYTASEAILRPGDTIVLYTDGLTEAAGPDEEEYGEERLAGFCGRHRADDLQTLAAAIEADQDGFVEGTPYADDRTLVLIRRT